ncbi:MAG: NADH-quinone oxidoreductase subunit NuoH [Phycisphaerales bacterium]|nr:NADH-quinone oxidoreductase subunit NuoH [Phycisphaerales bacterium]
MTAQLVVNVIVIVVMVHVLLGGCAYGVMLERKLSAWMQDRIGPNRVGPRGLLQPIADGIKFLLKEEHTPSGADSMLFTLAPGLSIIPAMAAFVIIPWGGTLDLSTLPTAVVSFLTNIGITMGSEVRIAGADLNVGIIYLIAVASLGVYGVALGGWASNSKFSFLGGLRASAQMISYEIPMGLAVLCVILAAGSLDPYQIIASQQAMGWNLVQQPLVAIVFYACILAEANRAPFDLAEAESELVGGFHTEYSSMRFAMFFLAEYFHVITGSAFFSLLFLGGWSINPLGGLFPGWDLPAAGSIALVLLQVAVMLGKTAFMLAFAMAVRWTIPRFRFDQLMSLAWEGMIPATLLFLTATATMTFLGLPQYLWLSSLGCLGIVWIVRPLIRQRRNPNHRLQLLGSRFSPTDDEIVASASKHPVARSDGAIQDPRQGPVSIH